MQLAELLDCTHQLLSHHSAKLNEGVVPQDRLWPPSQLEFWHLSQLKDKNCDPPVVVTKPSAWTPPQLPSLDLGFAGEISPTPPATADQQRTPLSETKDSPAPQGGGTSSSSSVPAAYVRPRMDGVTVKQYARGSTKRAIEIASNPGFLAAARAKLDDRIYSVKNMEVRAAKLDTWSQVARAAKYEHPFELTKDRSGGAYGGGLQIRRLLPQPGQAANGAQRTWDFQGVDHPDGPGAPGRSDWGPPSERKRYPWSASTSFQWPSSPGTLRGRATPPG